MNYFGDQTNTRGNRFSFNCGNRNTFGDQTNSAGVGTSGSGGSRNRG